MRLSYDAADHKFASNNAVGKDDIFNSAVIDVAEKTLIIAGSVDSYAADGMAVSIKDASERSGADVISDGSIVALVFTESSSAVCDVITELEVFVVEVVGSVAVSAVHAFGKEVETCGAGNNIWMIL